VEATFSSGRGARRLARLLVDLRRESAALTLIEYHRNRHVSLTLFGVQNFFLFRPSPDHHDVGNS
jgi:hypothetical protein